MIDYFTEGIVAARAGTRIYTLLVYACFVLRTLRTDFAFWLAIRRHANVVRLARANGVTVHFVAVTVWSARSWYAWVRRRRKRY